MISRTVSVLLFLALGVGLATAEVIQSVSASPQSDGVVVKWTSVDETGVAYYLVERSQQGGPFIPVVARFAAKGSGQKYEYVDVTAFKILTDTYYTYRVTPLDAAGNMVGNERPTTTVVSKQINSVRRTWGSIKAMFR